MNNGVSAVMVLMMTLGLIQVLGMVWLGVKMAQMEGNTNHIMDQLLKVTGESEYQKGLKMGEAVPTTGAPPAISVTLGPVEEKK